MTNLIAASSIPIAPSGGFTGFGPLGNVTSKENAVSTFSKFISSTIGILTIVAILWFIFVFITGAISIIGSGGDKAQLETAKKKITTGLIGLFVTIAAIFVIKLIGSLIGIPDILNFGILFSMITGLTP
ncbi:MAG: hypothetical protein NTZ07_02505 [Candidatus Woesebacteria bacterium]|nr:hypothetical protein [Candidatus Woesebacteria bacterium]